uniref:Microneme protein 3 n=1 Tax=Eimeria stiedai TaxID=471275 RepID=A0A6H0C3L4_9EIME|nr:microneme protein 3 [Eimeria stiedai]
MRDCISITRCQVSSEARHRRVCTLGDLLQTSSPKSLQEILDEKCKVNGEEACNVKNLTHYCGAKMYARKDLGTASQQAKVWRCYAETSLHMDVSGENCVDDCGNMKSCLGAVVGSSTAHLSYTAQLEALIDENRKTDCSTEEPVVEELTVEEARSSTSSPESLQDILDEKCRVDGEEACNSMNLVDFCGAEVYARKDLGTASQQVKAWRCYTRSALNMKMSGENCVDDCGNMKSCLGVVMGTSTSHMTRVAQLEALIADNRKTDCSTEQEVTENRAPETRDIKVSLISRVSVGAGL